MEVAAIPVATAAPPAPVVEVEAVAKAGEEVRVVAGAEMEVAGAT